MKSVLRLTLASILLLSAAFLGGCAYSNKPYRSTEVGLLGIVGSKDGAYTDVEPTTLHVKVDEVIPQSLPSGRRTELLWGLITVTDY